MCCFGSSILKTHPYLFCGGSFNALIVIGEYFPAYPTNEDEDGGFSILQNILECIKIER